MIKEITQEDFQSEVLDSPEIVLVDFYAEWCGPCKMLAPIMESINETYRVFKVNVDEEAELAEQYQISSIPCVISFKDGKEYKRSIGLKSKEEILEVVK